MTATETETQTESSTGVATHQVALSFEDGVTRFITVREDQTVADASYRQRINIPLDCRDGACGTCKALCESGDFDGGTYIEDALSEAEAAEGYALPCSMKPRSDLALQIATTSEVAKTGAASYTGTVVGLDRLSPTTVQLAIDIPNRGELAFLPGQYVNITVPGTEVTRSYSFANAPHEERLVFLVKLTPGGAMSTWLTERAAVGDEVTFTGPNGSFFLRDARSPLLMLAGGTGLAPVLSMLRQLHVDGCDRSGRLVYGVSTDDDLVLLDDVGELVSRLPGFTWDHCVSDPASSAVNKGYVMSLIGDEHLNGGDVAIYLCGPPPMVEAVRTHLGDVGVEPAGFHYEKFALATPVGEPKAAPASPPAPAPASPPAPAPAAEPTPAPAGRAASASERVETNTVAVLLESPDARGIGGQTTFARDDSVGLTVPDPAGPPPRGSRGSTDDGDVIRRIAGQLVAPAPAGRAASASERVETNAVASLAESPGARGVGKQEIFARDDSVLTVPDPAEPAPRPRFITPGRFAGQVVVVTGAAQGIGAQVARRVAAEGGKVVLADRSPLVAEVTGELTGQGASATPVECDLESYDGAAALVERALAAYARIDVLINNVGGAINFKPFTEFTAEQIDAEITRSLMTTLYACRAVLPGMVERGSGVIVNVSSAATRGIHRIPYSAAKGGINAITASLALEYADAGIRVAATAPGGTEAPPRRISRGTPTPRTETEKAWFQAHIDQTLDTSLMHRYGTLDEQAAAICFLASEEASYITGTVLPVAGGDLG
ncbi:benzoate/toluate 1,2-dioxygenase reductase subunit [Nocardioides luteus]|uniref:Oxidoreductase n=1 Tax=Nocardioides luteus TaxID=1844 RepID=A0ABQ5SWS5_9ACTN|nr:benzoate 1,2-dioxygenase electron transfer component BenC [Nocardioides luteus]MDR7311860.1 benzoate/toluate 1,2-dioxygenase reductase subunit [Nocardioides luteus]GGR66835.1 hypothetical protein GCM10010197_37950 [Nocardioides luteus]GLJ68103.1 hypothetical protein GCM10017579_21390 [Nocardioides luteus]